MTSDAGPSDRIQRARATIIPSCSERYFFEWIYPYARFGTWSCTYCGDPIEYAADGTVYIGRLRLSCRIEDLRGFSQLGPNDGASVSVNRCCSDRISAADQVMVLGRALQCPICGDTYTSAMITRWQGSSQVKGYVRDGQGFAVDHNLAVPALIPVERLSSRVY